MMNTLKLLTYPDHNLLHLDEGPCEWIFTRRAVDVMRGLDNGMLARMLLDFTSVFPLIPPKFSGVSEQLCKLADLNCMLYAVTTMEDGTREERLLHLGDGSCSALVSNDL